jgi:hypothetical protein
MAVAWMEEFGVVLPLLYPKCRGIWEKFDEAPPTKPPD